MSNKGKKGSDLDLLKESHLTYEDYDSIDDGHQYELVNGQLPWTLVTHQKDA